MTFDGKTGKIQKILSLTFSLKFWKIDNTTMKLDFIKNLVAVAKYLSMITSSTFFFFFFFCVCVLFF